MTIIFGDDEDNSFDVTSASDADLHIDGGLGEDTINILWGDIEGVVGEYYGPDSRAVFDYYGTAGWARLTFTHIETVNVTFGDAIDVLRVYNNAIVRFDGGGGDDLFDADFSASTADIRFTLDEAAGARSLFEGQGTVLTNVERVSVTTGAGNDTLTGGAGRDSFFAREGINIINAGGGDDSILSYGIDTVDGGDGFDSWIGDYSGATDALRLEHGTGHEYLLSNGVAVRNVEAIDLYSGSGDDVFEVALPLGVESHAYMNVRGGEGHDRLDIDWSGGKYAQIGSWVSTSFFSLRNVQTSDQISAENIEQISLKMGKGNDSFELSGGIAQIDGGAGIDHVSANFQWATDDIRFALNQKAGAVSTFEGQGSSLTNVERVGITTGAGNDSLTGGKYDDALDGGAGDDIINGGGGDDYLRGGDGVDTLSYAGNAMGVTVTLISGIINTIGAGSDNISDFENLRGSKYADRLTGDSGRNMIEGGGGADWLDGGAADDTLYGGDGHDELIGGAGVDGLNGGAGDDILSGGEGDDYLSGGAGADRLSGGAGNDNYAVHDNRDTIIEIAGEGVDSVTVYTGRYTLAANVENLYFSGQGNFVGIGNSEYNAISTVGGRGDDILRGLDGNDRLSSGSGNDLLDGGAGADSMYGATGDDSYIVDSAGDLVTETLDAGYDMVSSSIAYILPDHVEKLVLTGLAAIDGTGNGADNWILGNAAANRLDGGAGADRLEGGLGDDMLDGMDGDDLLLPGGGNNIVDGGAGFDTLLLDGVEASYSYVSTGGAVFIVGEEGATRLSGVEQVQFANALLTTGDLHDRLNAFDGLRYVAGFGDLIEAIGMDAAITAGHYADYGFGEGRDAKAFDPLDYVAGYSDLIGVFGTDEQAATRHYLSYGYGEGRSDDLFDGLQYVASYDDLIGAIGTDTEAAARHYIQAGRGEGRAADAFDGLRYIASNTDLIVAIGHDDDAAAAHYIRFGRGEGRDTDGFDALAYAAANADLAVAFGNDADALTRHYIDYGYYEHRALSVPTNAELFVAA